MEDVVAELKQRVFDYVNDNPIEWQELLNQGYNYYFDRGIVSIENSKDYSQLAIMMLRFGRPEIVRYSFNGVCTEFVLQNSSLWSTNSKMLEFKSVETDPNDETDWVAKYFDNSLLLKLLPIFKGETNGTTIIKIPFTVNAIEI